MHLIEWHLEVYLLGKKVKEMFGQMAKKTIKSSEEYISSKPAMSEEAQENRMIALAMDVAEKQLREGKASPSVVVHFLKMGSVKERMELEKLQKEKELLEAKVDALESSKRIEELYEEAIRSMRSYGGTASDEPED